MSTRVPGGADVGTVDAVVGGGGGVETTEPGGATPVPVGAVPPDAAPLGDPVAPVAGAGAAPAPFDDPGADAAPSAVADGPGEGAIVSAHAPMLAPRRTVAPAATQASILPRGSWGIATSSDQSLMGVRGGTWSQSTGAPHGLPCPVVERLGPSSAMLGAIFEQFTERGRRVLVLAQEEARLLHHSFLGTEHILLGLLHEGESVAAQALAQLDISLEAARAKVDDLIGDAAGSGWTGSPGFTPRAKKVLELSLKEALQLGHQYIGTEHLLLGVVREGQGVGAQVLVSLGTDMVDVRKTVARLLHGSSPGAETGTATLRPPVRVPPVTTPLICSFCGRRQPETGRLVASGPAVICEHCIREWHERLDAAGEVPGHDTAAHLVEPPEEDL